MIKRAISILSLIAFLGSSLGIHIVHHNPLCCGLDSEVINLGDLIQNRNSHCCVGEPVSNCHCCGTKASQCQSDSKNFADNLEHKSCCEHEVIGLKDNYIFQKQVVKKYQPVLVAILDWRYDQAAGIHKNVPSGAFTCRPPTNGLLEQTTFPVTCAILC